MLTVLLSLAMAIASGGSFAGESVCYGTPAQGRIENAVRLPSRGANFSAYSATGVTLGRTYAHARVVNAAVIAYRQLAKSMPRKNFVYGETGLARGGRFKPHRSHQNGLSVDFMVPVIDASGHSVLLPGNTRNRYGYDIEFDAKARYRDLRIDFEAIAEHLFELHRAGRNSGATIDRVIFEPAYLPKLFATKRGAFLRKNIKFVHGKVWWRHDEHYHVDFSTPCRKL